MNPLLNLLDIMRQTDALVMAQIQTLNQHLPPTTPSRLNNLASGDISDHAADLLDTLGRQQLDGALETLSRLDAVACAAAHQQRTASTVQDTSVIDIQAVEMPGNR